MTKQTFIKAADMVRAIRDGKWTSDPPRWADRGYLGDDYYGGEDGAQDYTRAVQTAEAFILLFQQSNPRFDQERFLIACGLVEKTK